MSCKVEVISPNPWVFFLMDLSSLQIGWNHDKSKILGLTLFLMLHRQSLLKTV